MRDLVLKDFLRGMTYIRTAAPNVPAARLFIETMLEPVAPVRGIITPPTGGECGATSTTTTNGP